MWDSNDGPEAPELILKLMREALDKPVLLESEFASGTEAEPSNESTTDGIRFEKDLETGDLMLYFPKCFYGLRTGVRVPVSSISHRR
jgi:hypothetical protein